jgi:hypothetical protein
MDHLTQKNTSNRLIVVMDDCLSNNDELAHAIFRMAERENKSVLYLVLVDDPNNLLTVSRNMATMKAVTSANKINVEVQISKTDYWWETLAKAAGDRDVIVCQEEQIVKSGLFETIPLKDFISSRIKIPVRTLSGFYHPFQAKAMKWLHELVGLLGFLGIMAFFTWLQIDLDQSLHGVIKNIYIVITLIFEIGAIWIWFRLAYR